MKILIATDGSKFSEAAIRKACELAVTPQDICFRIIAVYEPKLPMAAEPFSVSAEYFADLEGAARGRAEKDARDGVELINACFPSQRVCVVGNAEVGRPAQVIVETAESWGADLIVVGPHGHGFWGRLTLGSVSDAVVHHAKCSVVVVKNAARIA